MDRIENRTAVERLNALFVLFCCAEFDQVRKENRFFAVEMAIEVGNRNFQLLYDFFHNVALCASSFERCARLVAKNMTAAATNGVVVFEHVID